MQLTKEHELAIQLATGPSGRLPRFDSFARKQNLSNEDAQSILRQYAAKVGKRVRGEVVEVEPEAPKPPVSVHTIFDWLVDGGALILAIVIDLVLNIVVFVTIAPDALTKVGMAGLAFLVVLFSVRGWLKGGWAGKSLWLLFALVATFSDLSFALYATDVQTKTAVDTELTRLTDEATKAGKYLESLQSLQLEKGQGYAQQVKDAREALGEANAAVSGYHAKDAHVGLTASGVFSAIPDSVGSGRWIELVFFSLVFAGLQLTIISAAGVVRREE